MHEFNIFIKKKKIYITNSLIVYSLLFTILIIGYTKDKIFNLSDNNLLDKIYLALVIIVVGYSIVSLLITLSMYKILKGKIEGTLSLEKDIIRINNFNYFLKDISNINLFVNDYKGNFISRGKGDFDPCLSNGVDNSIILTLTNGEKISTNFQQLKEKEILKAKEELIHYYHEDKLHFLKLIELFGISKYEEVQKFKEKINTYR